MSSQYEEDKLIHNFFGDKRDGRFLDIGAYDGKTFSNIMALAECGWSGVCVEASPQCFLGLQKTYWENPNVILVNAAVGTSVGCAKFYDTGGAVASLSKAHMEKWKDRQDDFREIHVASITPEYLLRALPGPYDFISIDIEGISLDVFGLFPDLRKLGVQLVCVEVDNENGLVRKLMEKFGLVLYGRTIENWLLRVQ